MKTLYPQLQRSGVISPKALRYGINPAVLNGTDVDPTALTLYNAMTVKPDATRFSIIDTTIRALKGQNVLGLNSGLIDFKSKMDWLYVCAAHDSQAGLLDWFNPTTDVAVPVNSPTFTVNSGYAGNGSSSYVAINRCPGYTAGLKYQANSAHVGWYVTQEKTVGTQWTNIGSQTRSIIFTRIGGSPDYASSCLDPLSGVASSPFNIYAKSNLNKVYMLAVRDASTERASFNGTDLHTLVRGTGSHAFTGGTKNYYIVGGNRIWNSDGGLYWPHNARTGITHAGSGLSDSEHSVLAGIFNYYMTQIGANVY